MKDDLAIAKKECRQQMVEAVAAVAEKYSPDDLLASRVGWGSGRGRFRGLFWLKVNINPRYLKQRFSIERYDCIYATPYCINKQQIEQVYGKMVSTEPADAKYIGATEENWLPHIDSFTGNVHVAFDEKAWMEKPCVQQVVLMHKIKGKQYGTKLENVDLFSEQNIIKYREDVLVSGDCYYKKIDDNSEEEMNLQMLLNGLLETVVDERYKKRVVGE